MIESEIHFLNSGFQPGAVREVLVGLSRTQKTLSPKFLYDRRGSEIFEEICKLKEYYPVHAEREILSSNAAELAEFIGEDCLVLEPGSGNGEKIRHLLPHLRAPRGYVPIEISREMLQRMTKELQTESPELSLRPVCADFTQLDFKTIFAGETGRKVVFFPGSTIGNFSSLEALNLLVSFRSSMAQDGGLLIGVDLKKDPQTLKLAYDDPHGVTAEFNLNLLSHLNREAGANFELGNFYHDAFYNEELGRVEMHLRSKLHQLVRVNQTVFRFLEGESIHTENSYKYSVEEFSELAGQAGFRLVKTWKDSQKLFCVYYFEKIER